MPCGVASPGFGKLTVVVGLLGQGGALCSPRIPAEKAEPIVRNILDLAVKIIFSPRLKSPCLHRELLTDDAVFPIIIFLKITAFEVKMAHDAKSLSSNSDNLSSILESMQICASVYCVHVHICVYACICVYMYTYVYECVLCVYVGTCTHVYVYMCVHVHICVCMNVCVCVCVHLYLCVCIHAYTRLEICGE